MTVPVEQTVDLLTDVVIRRVVTNMNVGRPLVRADLGTIVVCIDAEDVDNEVKVTIPLIDEVGFYAGSEIELIQGDPAYTIKLVTDEDIALTGPIETVNAGDMLRLVCIANDTWISYLISCNTPN
jgi:CO dehydrogenase/acetyl-CoA synthase alpha subunit